MTSGSTSTSAAEPLPWDDNGNGRISWAEARARHRACPARPSPSCAKTRPI